MYNTLQYSSQGEMITDRGAACHLRRSLIGGFDCRKTGDGVRTNWSRRIIVTCMHRPVQGHLWTGPELVPYEFKSRKNLHAPYESIRYTTNNHLINPAFGQRDQLVCSLMFIIQVSTYCCTIFPIYCFSFRWCTSACVTFFYKKIKAQNKCWHSHGHT